MKNVLRCISLRVTQKLLTIFFCIAGSTTISAQCIPGSNTANLNWDNLDYLITTGNYSGYVTAAMSQTQAFMLGVNRVVINYPGTITTVGENTTHTGEAGSFGTGADVQYTGNGNITITFDAEVNNFQFSLYDIDNSQRVNVTAVDAAATPLNITMTRPAGGNVTITGSGTTNAQGQAPATASANNVTTATVNLLITGPVKTVTIAMSGTAGDFWLSDFIACVVGTFSNNYFVASRPFTGQPTYVIGTSDTNTVSLINTTTGAARMIFQDASSPRYINGIAYDHLQSDLYYVIDFTTTPATNKSIKRYNFDTETISVLVANVNTLGIPTYNRGVESAGSTFYDSCLYFGVEGNLTPGNNSGRETIIWRINFTSPGGAANTACQVYATPSDNGAGTSLHDWSDFSIADGLLVDFAGAPNIAARRYTHYDLQTQSIVNNYYTGGSTPRQAGITWDDTRYWVYDSIAVYNMNGTIGPRTRITGPTVLDWKGFCGDATGFRPKSDFGDAPASYDPDPLSPALHEKDTALYIGTSFLTGWDQEFNKLTSGDATGDGADDNDGLLYVPIFNPAASNYLAYVRVYNNRGSNASLIAWLDFNANGQYDASEAITPITVPPSSSVQGFFLYWPWAPTTIPNGSFTFLRIRLTAETNSMTTTNATGYYSNGEVEDYRVLVDDFPLSATLLEFDARPINYDAAVRVTWSTTNEQNLAGFIVERSDDNISWNPIGMLNPQANDGRPETSDYSFDDLQPYPGRSFYRLKISNLTGNDLYSETRTVYLGGKGAPDVSIAPNPVNTVLNINVYTNKSGFATVLVTDMAGKVVLKKATDLVEGSNCFSFAEAQQWLPGGYNLMIQTAHQTITRRFTVVR